MTSSHIPLSMEARDSFYFPKKTKNPNPSPIGKKFRFCCCGADKRTWTSTELPRLEPESNASANSAISAYSVVFVSRDARNDSYYTRCGKIVKHFFEKLFIFLERIILSHFLQAVQLRCALRRRFCGIRRRSATHCVCRAPFWVWQFFHGDVE